MINILKAFAFAFSANIDNIAIGMSYGIKKINIPIKTNFIISLFMSIITYITMFIGKSISNLFNINLVHTIGTYTLIFIGLYFLIKEIICKKENIEKGNLSKLNLKNIILVIFTLSTNNIATGLAVSMIDTNLLFTFLFTFLFSFFMLYIGNKIGKNIINYKLEKFSNIISALILIFLGIFQLK